MLDGLRMLKFSGDVFEDWINANQVNNCKTSTVATICSSKTKMYPSLASTPVSYSLFFRLSTRVTRGSSVSIAASNAHYKHVTTFVYPIFENDLRTSCPKSWPRRLFCVRKRTSNRKLKEEEFPAKSSKRFRTFDEMPNYVHKSILKRTLYSRMETRMKQSRINCRLDSRGIGVTRAFFLRE